MIMYSIFVCPARIKEFDTQRLLSLGAMPSKSYTKSDVDLVEDHHQQHRT